MATSEEIVINETLSGRIYKQPRTLALSVDGTLTLPDGVNIDFSRVGTFQVPQTLKTELVNTVISQMPSVLDGNIIHLNTNSSATDAVNSMILASNTGTITGNVGLDNALYDGILCSDNCYSDGAVSNSLIESSVDCHFSNPTTPAMTNLNLIGCSSCSINNTSSNSTPARCSIISSNTSSINTTGITSNENDSSIIASGAATMTLTGGCGMLACFTCNQAGSDNSNRVALSAIMAAGSCSQTGYVSQSAIVGSNNSTMVGTNNSAIIASRLSGMPNTGTNSTLVETNLIGGSYQCFITRNPANFPLYRNALLSSSTCTITNAIRETTNSLLSSSRECTIDGGNYNSIISSYLCNVKTNTGALAPPVYSSILSSTNSTIGTVNSYGITTAVIASDNCIVNQGTYNAIIASNNAVFGGSVNHSRCVALCSTGATFTNPSANVLLGGLTAISSNGYSNVIAWGASPTASNQAVFGVNTRIAGSGNSLSVEGGYVRAASGFVDGARSSSVNTTLAFGDSTVILSSNATLTLPLATTFGASYPLDTVVKFKIIRTNGGNTLLTTGTDKFNQTSAWLTYSRIQPYVEMLLVNTAVSPHWRFAHVVPVSMTLASYTVDNYFGITPPKSDANQLPLSATQVAHEALTDASYCSFSDVPEATAGGPLFTNSTPPGMLFRVSGDYRVTYRFDVRTVSGGGRYLIRSDIRRNTTGLSILGSYTETAGLNAQDGTRHVEVTLPTMYFVDGEVLTLRLSQDSTNPINASASIRQQALCVDGRV